jgi:16S rRNA (guanine527-N7)-methyltransferase
LTWNRLAVPRETSPAVTADHPEPREPIEATPPAAATIFGPRLDLATRYAELLADEATVRGLIGPAEISRLWSRHLLNSAAIAELVPAGVEVIDVGSGAGLPGIPLAIARPDLRLTLVEPLLRRSTWLETVVDRLGLTGVRVIRGRAEGLAGQLSAPCVIARAVAPMERLARWCLPLVQGGGELLAMKGDTASRELATATELLTQLGAEAWEVRSVGQGILADPTSVIRVKVGSGGVPIRTPQGRKSSPTKGRQHSRGGAR